MKILELIAIPTLTGAGAPMLNLSRRLKEAGHKIDIYIDQYRPHNLHEILKAEGLEPHAGLALSTIAPPHKNIADVFKLARMIKNGGYDLLICHLSHDHTLAAVARTISGHALPIVRCLHSARSLKDRLFQKMLWKHTDAVITHTPGLAQGLCDSFSFPSERILYLPAEVDTQKFRPPTADEKLTAKRDFGFTPADFVLGYVARIKHGRCHAELVGAFSEVCEMLPPSATSVLRPPRLRLIIVGDGESLPDVKELARRLGVCERIVFTGYLDENLPWAYMAMDAYIQMAVGNDASCRAVLEAAASGLQAWCVPEAAACDCCKIFNMDGIKVALGDIYSDGNDYGKAARSCIERKHSGKESAASLDVFLTTLLKSAKSGT